MILVYDVTDEKTFHNIEEWMRCISENTQECQIIQKVILANKIDLPLDLHRVSSQVGQDLASKHGIDYFEVSAKEGQNINEAFIKLTNQVMAAQELQLSNHSNDSDIVVLHDIPVLDKRKKRQCCK